MHAADIASNGNVSCLDRVGPGAAPDYDASRGGDYPKAVKRKGDVYFALSGIREFSSVPKAYAAIEN